MSPADLKPESSTPLTVDDALEAVQSSLTDLGEAVAAMRRVQEEAIFRMEEDMGDLSAELAESRDADVWISRVVRETEGKLMDGLSPGAVLVWVVGTLKSRRGLFDRDKVA